MKMPKKQIRKWIDALRSGEYRQERRWLQTSGGYCCIGVACKIFISDSKQRLRGTHLHGNMAEEQPNCPRWLRSANYEFYSRTGETLTTLNDQKGFSFAEIADLLQAVYIEEVL